MFGIKLIQQRHLEMPVFTHDFDESDGRSPLMNFNVAGKSYVAGIPVGHRCLVYVTSPWRRFLWAVEITGTLADGERAYQAHGYDVGTTPWGEWKWSLHRPIAFLARVDTPDRPAGPTDIQGTSREEIEQRSGFSWRPYGPGHYYISGEDFQRAFNAIDWSWTSGGRDVSRDLPPRTIYIQPPLPDPDRVLRRIGETRDALEREVEDVVKTTMVELGHNEGHVRFRIGHADLRLNGPSGEAVAVIEVKRPPLAGRTRDQARRQAFDYANQTGARYVVLTDADVYVIYDRARAGFTFDEQICGEFQLTRFRLEDEGLLDLLRPRGLQVIREDS